MKLPRYTQARATASGVVEYRFNPPQTLVDAGVVTRRQFGSDLKQVRKLVRQDNKNIDAWRVKNATENKVYENSTLTSLINSYYESYDFKKLRENTANDYKYFLSVVNISLGQRKFNQIDTKLAKKHYEQWLVRGVSFANHVCTCISRVYNHAVLLEKTDKNPFSNVKRKPTAKRTVVWSRDDVVSFLDFAYSDFSTRNVGLIVQMAYEFCQRIGDMRSLQWDSFSSDLTKLNLEQSKRRAKVELPVSDDLREMLAKQREDFGFQSYVCPQIKPVQGEYVPYGKMGISHIGRRLMRKAGLSNELRLMDLRRTGIMEMVDAGVSLPQVMSVSGHSNPASVKPYMKNTYASANSALTMRKKHVKSVLKQEGV